ncbi:MAG: ketoacyl-ACP synthase III [Actinomyces sp.]|nr:MAG: ketoacyl-ACP synthase III [Actinomyces sp.]
MGAHVRGVGTALPERVVTNDDLAATMDTSDDWIRERTGIRERRVGGTTGQLAIEAGAKALADAGVDPAEVDLLVLSTTTPDQRTPATSAAVHAGLGLRCGAFDVNAACAGFTYAWVAANGMMELPHGPRRVLVIGADALSTITDWTDRSTAILFADAAGAVVLEHRPEPNLLGWDLGADGSLVPILYCDHGDTLKMEGREVFKRAVRAVVASVENALERAGLTPDDIDVLLPHQANIRIIEAVCSRLGIPADKTVNVIETTGNTSSATIPLCIDAARSAGVLHEGRIVCMTGFGAGMTWATTVVRW